MRILLDTNIIIHREANNIIKKEIGPLFYWLDYLKYDKCIHPLSIKEIEQYHDPKVVATFKTKMDSYHILKTESPESPAIQKIRAAYDKKINDHTDTSLLKEVFNGRVDFLITEDRVIHKKASILGIGTRIFTIDSFLEKVTAENPGLIGYKVLAVKKEHFGNININDPFFDSFKQDYHGFEQWFNRKADETAYICKADDSSLLAFLYVKIEQKSENYMDIHPQFEPKLRLKVGTFKVIANGYKLGERFLKIIFDNALVNNVEEIYLTIFNRTEEQQRLTKLIEDWGFTAYGIKNSNSGEEKVYVRNFSQLVNRNNPQFSYPYFSLQGKKFIVPIYPQYHTELLPDSVLRTESPLDFIENRPNRNAISKVYISRSIERNLSPSDIIVFYRTQAGGPAHYTSVATSIGVVQKVISTIPNLENFIEHCRKRSVFSDAELKEQWNYKPNNRPFIVNFLYVHSFPKRLNLENLRNLGIISEPPRGFEMLTDNAFEKLLEKSNADQRLIAN